MSAPPAIHARLASGRLINLLAPPDTIDFAVEIAGPLSRIARFAGQVPGLSYSVAEHCVRGALALYTEARQADYSHRRSKLALAFLLHDDHEAIAGDVTRPFVRLAASVAGDMADGCAGDVVFTAAIAEAKDRISAFVHRAAGVPWPLDPEIAAIVRTMDNRMLATEQRALWPQPAAPDPAVAGLPPVHIHGWEDGTTVSEVWPAEYAAARWMQFFNEWRPA